MEKQQKSRKSRKSPRRAAPAGTATVVVVVSNQYSNEPSADPTKIPVVTRRGPRKIPRARTATLSLGVPLRLGSASA